MEWMFVFLIKKATGAETMYFIWSIFLWSRKIRTCVVLQSTSVEKIDHGFIEKKMNTVIP